MKLAVVVFNLGGPDGPEAVEPFLRNLFSDPAVISLPGLIRKPLARFIARRRAPVARKIYDKIGGRSPILEETQAQAQALEREISGWDTRVFVAMRCWKPFSEEAARDVAAWVPDRVVLLPLYPQFSTTTTASSLKEWRRAAAEAGISAPTSAICCYPKLPGFIEAVAELTLGTLAKAKTGTEYRLLFSAHGLPKRVIERGDPYQMQVERTAAALAARLGADDWVVCYQSRVGPLEWIGPATDEELRKAGAEGKGVVVVPIAFVSEHSETLVELDIEYAHLAREAGVGDYLRVPTAGVQPAFIRALAGLVTDAAAGKRNERSCPSTCHMCGNSWT